MSEQLWWYVARSGGIVALLLAFGSVLWGLLLASGFLDRDPGKRWLLSVHRWLGGLTVTFSAIHVAALWFDSYIQYSLTELFVPFVSDQPPGRWALTVGIVSFYLLLAVQATSLAMKRLPRRLWRWVHLSSYGLLAAGITHGALAGTDASHPLYVAMVVVLGLATVFLTTFRVVTARRFRRPRRSELVSGGVPA